MDAALLSFAPPDSVPAPGPEAYGAEHASLTIGATSQTVQSPLTVAPEPASTLIAAPWSVPLPQSPVASETAREASDLQSGRKAQRDGGIGSAAKDASVCPMCKGGGRNLVVCIDGTSNQFSKKNTNVVELYSRLVKSNDKQLTFYNSGIGTYARPSWRSLSYFKQVIANKLDLAFALRFDKIILSSYTWLADNYVEGDRIFLFGFSRGAYQVRALSAMIHRMGLIHKGNADQIPFAYELYSTGDIEDRPLTEGEASVLQRIAIWAISALALQQGLSTVWFSGRGSNVLKQMTICAIFTLIFLPCLRTIWSGGRETIPAALDADGSSVAGTNDDGESTSDRSSQMDETHGEAVPEMQKRFKKAFARDVKVHFVGAWDTVSSVGLVRDKTLPGTTDGMLHVCYFRHALALHERRVKFLPEFVYGGLGPSNIPGYYDVVEEARDMVLHAIHEIALGAPYSRNYLVAVATALSAITSAVLDYLSRTSSTPPGCPSAPSQPSPSPPTTSSDSSAERDPPHTKEVWFHGSHSDIGGGASPNERLRRFGPALRWMSFEARLAGLNISKEPRRWDTELFNTGSFSPFWKLIEFLPVKRLTYDGASGTTYRPHFSSKRRCQPGQLVYGGLSDGLKARLCRAGLKIEPDPYLGAEDLLKRLQQDVKNERLLREEDRVKMETLISSVLGQQQLRDMKDDISPPLVDMLSLYKRNFRCLPFTPDVLAIQRLLYGLEYSFNVMANSRPLYKVLGIQAMEGPWAFPRPVTLHDSTTMSVLCLSDGERIISTDLPGHIKIWDMSTGQPAGTLEGVDHIWAISPDGRYAVREGPSFPLEVLDLSLGTIFAKLTELSATLIYATTCSSDCQYVACGYEGGISLWDIQGIAKDAPPIPSISLRSGRLVMSLAFCSQGSYLAAGGTDAAIQIWDMKKRVLSGGELVGHRAGISAVAFSPDDGRLVSASADGVLRIWCMDTHATIHVIPGHGMSVQAVAFSPNGKFMISGSHDFSVRIWDTTTGQLVGVPLNGHTSAVNCLTFSRDGTRVIAGAQDGAIRIWDRMPAVPLVDHGVLHVPAQTDLASAPMLAAESISPPDVGPGRTSLAPTETEDESQAGDGYAVSQADSQEPAHPDGNSAHVAKIGDSASAERDPDAAISSQYPVHPGDGGHDESADVEAGFRAAAPAAWP